MDKQMEDFLLASVLAKKISLPSSIVVHRTSLSLLDVRDLYRLKVYPHIPKDETTCELEIGAQRLARGRIIKKCGEYYFKVGDLVGNDKAKEERG